MSSDIIEMQPRQVALPDLFPHGGGIEAAASRWGCDTTEILDLSTGLHPAGAPTWLEAWLGEHASLAAHYPDSAGEPALSALAQAFAIRPENILITAGAQAAIEAVFQAMAWQSMAIQVPCYSEPIRCAKRAGCDVLAFESETAPVADILWLTSPSNPFGVTHHFPCGQAGVLDESYMRFSQRRTLGLMKDIIRIGSLTKTFSIPGLRLGYVIAERAAIVRLKAWLPPWPASTLAQHLLPELLADADLRDQQIIVARCRLHALLESYDWEVKASDASFVLARPTRSMPDFSGQRILVRRFPEWPQLSGWIRFGLPGDEEAWQRLEEAICPSH